jgi:hypothetical protein
LCRRIVSPSDPSAIFIVDVWLPRPSASVDVHALIPETRSVVQRSLSLFGADSTLCSGYVSDQVAERLTLYVRTPSASELVLEDAAAALVVRLGALAAEPSVSIAALR